MRSLKVLILEPNPFQLMALHQMLNAIGIYDVLTAPSLASALSSLGHRGAVDVESYTVMYGADGPSIAHVACRLPDGRRAWGNCSDAAVLEAMTHEEFCGRPAQLDGAGSVSFA